VIVVESHYAVGGAAHGFARKTARGEFKFDTGPSFFAGLTKPNALNPLASVFRLLGEELETVSYDPLGTFHIEPDAPGLRRHADLAKLVSEVKRFSPRGAEELERAVPKIRTMYASLSSLPTTALRADWKVALMILSRYMKAMAGLGPYSGVLPQPTVKLLDFLDIKDPWMRYLADLECFLLSGVDASGTVSAEFAAVFGASDSLGVSEFPRGGAEEIAKALQRGLEKYGGEVRLKTHVDEIIVENGTAVGVKLANGKGEIRAPIVLSNASVWDTYGTLLPKGAAPATETREAMETPYSESFMHLHLGIEGDGLDFTHTGGHHVVVLDKSKPISQPGNVCMISIASVWEPDMAPAGCHCVHAYTMEPFEGWEELKANDKQAYEKRKKEASDKLYVALERVIPDVRDRVLLELVASPATHKSWLRRHKGTYGAAIRAPAMFPGPTVAGIKNLYRVGDSVAPGVGVPAAAGSGVICANTLASLDDHFACQDRMDALNAR
jgi:phytoene dehydrogenase-like protein